jgi:hypothetical protein
MTKRCVLLVAAALVAGCRRGSAQTEQVVPEPGAMTRALASAAPARSGAPVIVVPPSPGEDLADQWFSLHDVGGTILASSGARLYRAESEQLWPVPFTVEPGGTAKKMPPEPLRIGHVLGHYPDNVWVTIVQGGGCRSTDFFVGRLDGARLLGDHVSSSGMGPWAGLINWTGTSVLQSGEKMTLHEGQGRRHLAGEEEGPGGCKGLYVSNALAHRGWVAAHRSCTSDRYEASTWLYGPQGQRLQLFQHDSVRDLHVTDQGEVWGLLNTWTDNPIACHWQLCRLDRGTSECEDLPPTIHGYYSFVTAREGGFLLVTRTEVLARPRPGELRPVAFFREGPDQPRVRSLLRDRHGSLWGIGSRDSEKGSFVFRSQL